MGWSLCLQPLDCAVVKIFNFLHLIMIPRLKIFPLVNNSASLPVTAREVCFYTCQHLCVQHSMQKSAQIKRYINFFLLCET